MPRELEYKIKSLYEIQIRQFQASPLLSGSPVDSRAFIFSALNVRDPSFPQVEPAWRLEDVFVYEVHQSALETDQTPMHPISGSVQTPAEIRGMFDDISYSKAGAVLRMLLYTVTEVNFKGALNFYLESNK